MNDLFEKVNNENERIKKERETRGYTVHGVKDLYKNNPLISNWVNVHTHGLEEYGLTNISIVAPEDDDRLSNVIYTIADMMMKGEEFILNATHFMDKPDGTCDFKFRLLPTKCFGEDTLRIILPDPDTNEFFIDKNGIEGIYCLQRTVIFEPHEKLSK
jgi:hypothetical protein